jgi:N-sulfoglucosamine sulfohydrolase
MKKILALASIFLFGVLNISSKTAYKKPNILFIIADDWSYPFAGFYGNKDLKTPNLDALAQNGVVFDNAFCPNPSCTPSRGSILTGKYSHNLKEGVNLVGRLDSNEVTYTKEFRKNGYAVAFDRKGWGPARLDLLGYKENPAGPKLEFNKFIDSIGTDKPFCYWWGTEDPHRPYDIGFGTASSIDSSKITVPKFLPDTPEIRGDLADYFAEIQRLDAEVGQLIAKLKAKGLFENTIIVVTSDNGMPFPHAKANLYDYGTRIPLLISYPKEFKKNIHNDSFVNLIDLFPTFMDFASIPISHKIDGISLLKILKGEKTIHRGEVYLERERHCMARAKEDNSYPGYPMRAVRTKEFLYIQNLRPDRNPAGDASIAGTPSEYGDVDGGRTKAYMMENKTAKNVEKYFKMGFEKRPAEELYDVKKDSYNLVNLAGNPNYRITKNTLKVKLESWMKRSNDPRVNGKGDEIDAYETYDKAWITKWGIVFWK